MTWGPVGKIKYNKPTQRNCTLRGTSEQCFDRRKNWAEGGKARYQVLLLPRDNQIRNREFEFEDPLSATRQQGKQDVVRKLQLKRHLVLISAE